MKKAVINRFKIFKLDLPFSSRLKLFFFSFASPFFKKIGVSLPAFEVNYGGGVALISDRTDLGTFLEVFLHKEYNIPDMNHPIKSILDLGANCGYASIYFARLFGESRIVAVEADPKNVEKIKINASKFDGRIIVEPSAISSKSGLTEFHLNFKTGISGSIISRDSKAEKITVPSLTLSDLEKKYGPFDVVKFDIEGEEWDAISPEMLIHRPKLWIGEYHEELTKRSKEDFAIRFKKYSVESRQIARKRFLMTFTDELKP